MGDRSETF